MKMSHTEIPSAHYQFMDGPPMKTTESAWRPLYRIGGAAALMVVLLYVIQIIILVVSPPPNTVIGFFTLFHRNALFVPLFLALFIALRRISPPLMAIATALGLVGIATYFASNTAFEMLSLSSQYAAATTDVQRSMLVASGQTMLAIYQGTAFGVSYLLLAIASLIISVVMLWSTSFGKVTAFVGIVANVLAIGLFVPAIGVFLSLISVVGLLIWYVLIARRLFLLAQGIAKKEATQH